MKPAATTPEGITPTAYQEGTDDLAVSQAVFPDTNIPSLNSFGVDLPTPEPSDQTPLWDAEAVVQWPSLFTGNEFDLDEMDLSLVNATFDLDKTMLNEVAPGFPRSSLDEEPLARTEDLIQQRWHTFSEPTPLGYTSPDPARMKDKIDEMCHKEMSDTLRQSAQSLALPSTAFLVRSSSIFAPNQGTNSPFIGPMY